MKNFLKVLGFSPKENTAGIFIKKYPLLDNYRIEVDFEKQTFYFGGDIKIQGKDIQNITKPEDWVVLECIDRLLIRGYKPGNISLEKVYPAWHGFSGRLDICVTRDDESEYLLIECKTWGKEFDKEFTRMKKDGGQLFTYFKFSNKADLIMLYASSLQGENIVYRNEIVRIQDGYRIGDVKDFYRTWDKITNDRGVWENLPYNFQNQTFTKKQLKVLSEEESKKIFHGFTSILRKHSVSDKPNAFNVIFNLFLAKLYDEAKGDDTELDFHWKEEEHPVDFQIKLYNLYTNGLQAFLNKEIEGINQEDFKEAKNEEELIKKKKKFFKFNNILAIKEVIDDSSFDANQRVLKEVVQLLEDYQIRYPRKQQYLSDFFEQLLTTGLKQEVGQYFTPPPVTKFIVRSLPLSKIIKQEVNKEDPKLPAIIDYAAGSGHFITEALEEYQDIINKIDSKDLSFPRAKSVVRAWQEDPYNWASTYVYGIEKDYRLVKVAKVGCYFYGDGVAQVIHGDGLDSFAASQSYVGLLKENTNLEDSTKAKFSVVVSNPPYSVDNCKDDLEYIGAEKEFMLFSSLTDKSKEIEALFVERTKQLLKDGGVAGIVLPSSILSNAGIYSRVREILLQYFDIVAIAEFGANTFMATDTKTVTLFLRRRNNTVAQKIQEGVKQIFEHHTDITIFGIETPLSKYIEHVWKEISLQSYISLLKKSPDEAIEKHEIFIDYSKKLKYKDTSSLIDQILEKEQEKLLYFILAYKQEVVLIKTGEKDVEKAFLWYKFSDRRKNEGIHPIRWGKTIDECTHLYDPKNSYNEQKASTYILEAFEGKNPSRPIDLSLVNHVSRVSLIDMITWDRVEFEKTISLSVKKKINFEEIWKTSSVQYLHEIAHIKKGTSITKEKVHEGDIPVVAWGQEPAYYHSESNRLWNTITVSASWAYSGFVNYFTTPIFASDCNTIQSKDENVISTRLIFHFLKSIQNEIYQLQRGQAQPHVYAEDLQNIKIPVPPLDIQQKIVKEMEILEKREEEMRKEIKDCGWKIGQIMWEVSWAEEKLENISILLKRGKSAKYGDSKIQIIKSGQARGLKEFDFSQKYYVEEGFTLDERKLQKWDILINSTWVGTAWRVTLFDLDGDFVVDSHVTILRLNGEKVLPNFVLQSLSKIWFKNIEAMATGQSGQIELSLGIIGNIKIPLPPLSEQQKIVAEIEKIEVDINSLESELVAIPAQKEAILKKYL